MRPRYRRRTIERTRVEPNRTDVHDNIDVCWNRRMRDSIVQYMWGYQQHFRASAEYAVERALRAIGASLDCRVVLVGYARDIECRHSVCIEPETGQLQQRHFDQVTERAQEIYAHDPEATIFHSVAHVHESRQRWLRCRARAQATSEAIENSGAMGDVLVFVSTSSPIGGYEVHTCICVESERFDALPALSGDYVDRQYVGRSLQHEVIAECLRRADGSLYLPDPGAGLNALNAATDEIVRSAARTFMSGCVIRSGEMIPAEPFDTLNALTAQTYERAPAEGGIVFISAEDSSASILMRLRRTVSLRESRAVRKLLETTDKSLALLTNGSEVYGLGRVDDTKASNDVFRVSVPSHAMWQLSAGANSLMKVSYGRASLPRPVLDRDAFYDVATRLIEEVDIDLLWSYVDEAAGAGHGTTLVISSDAEGEAQRLAGQATPIEPTLLSSGMVQRAGRIDGAVLLDPNGNCHAIGVILDGEARGIGDPARGSRYNSSVRYQSSAPSPTVVVVISDDGGVDLVPTLRPRVRAADVEAAVAEFREVNETDNVDGEAFGRAHRRVKDYAFYMNAAQCDEVNQLFKAEQDRRLKHGGIAIREADLHPHPEMNDSYWR